MLSLWARKIEASSYGELVSKSAVVRLRISLSCCWDLIDIKGPDIGKMIKQSYSG